MESDPDSKDEVPPLVDDAPLPVEKYPACPRVPLERLAFECDYKAVLDDPNVVHFRSMMKHRMDKLDERMYRESGLSVADNLITHILDARSNEQQQYIFPFKETSKWNNIVTACAIFDNMRVVLVMRIAPDSAAKFTNMGYSPRTDYTSVLKTATTFDLVFMIRRFNMTAAYKQFTELLNETSEIQFQILEQPEKAVFDEDLVDDEDPPEPDAPERKNSDEKGNGSCIIV